MTTIDLPKTNTNGAGEIGGGGGIGLRSASSSVAGRVRVNVVWHSDTEEPVPAYFSYKETFYVWGAGQTNNGPISQATAESELPTSGDPTTQISFTYSSTEKRGKRKCRVATEGRTDFYLDDLSVDVSSEVSANPQYPTPQDEIGSGCGYAYSIEVDSRFINISSNRDTTFHRTVVDGTPFRVANVPDKEGNVKADTQSAWSIPLSIPDLFFGIVYSGSAEGDFTKLDSAYTSYEWTFDKGDTRSYVTSGLIPVSSVPVNYTPEEAKTGYTVSATLTVTDPYDSWTDSVRYSMKMHGKWEDRTPLFDTEIPKAFDINSPSNEGWGTLDEINNQASEAPMHFPSHKWSISATGGWHINLAGGEATKKYLEGDIGTELKATFAAETTIPGDIEVGYGEWIRVYAAMAVTEHNGTYSEWGFNGYYNDVPYMYRTSRGGVRLLAVDMNRGKKP